MANIQDKSESEWVRVLSEDGWTFIVPRKVAVASGTLKNTLSTGFAEAEAATCHVPHRGAIVEKVMEYLSYKTLYESAGPKEDIPEFSERIQPELALELLMAADYLET
ncbi:POZ domain-containing protein [Sistotremastrum suecicum HHB10207 ss-3]|uniref:Elongin-C n=1 Tax=Sistotremastrum suecicum HHB10207 ss-3 TaxID=1314776 RepID=A0A166AF41_9AGAM|nr:POZ domain-containing protein [Sistotremastrum suecicum HHB10207 ss-3]